MSLNLSEMIFWNSAAESAYCTWYIIVYVWSPTTGSAVSSRVSLLILYTQAESDAYSRDSSRFPRRDAYSRDSSRFPRRRPFIYLNRHTSSSQSRVYRVTQLRTDGVHCRESAGTGPVVFKVVLVTGAAILQVTMDQLKRLSFPTPTVGMKWAC